MYEQKKIQSLDDYFKNLSARNNQGVYFYRIIGYNDAIMNFIRQYFEAARMSGAVIEGKIPNPDEKNLAYYEDIMGMEFQLSMGFLTSSLKKWLPRLTKMQQDNVAISIYDTLEAMRREGKNDNVLRNAYIKFMCWLYYRFENVVNQLGNDKIPKVLYEGDISNYELKLITILSKAGCDVVLLQYQGDQNYLKVDQGSNASVAYTATGMVTFPSDFSIRELRKKTADEVKVRDLYGEKPQIMNSTNTWIEGIGFGDVLKSIQARGSNPNLFYNSFYRINGVEDKLTYLNDLYQFQLQLKNNKCSLVVIENSIEPPTMEEIAAIERSGYTSQEQMLSGLSKNIKYPADKELQKLMTKTFIDIAIEIGRQPDMNLNKLTNRAVYLLCWLKRYQAGLFANWKMPEIACFIYLGVCKNNNESMFVKLLSRLPVDVLILNPNLNFKCCLTDEFLFEKDYEDSLAVDKFPHENTVIHMGTAAYHAERELDTLMYQDSGIYRNQQYHKAVSLTLQTMYEEIAILWNQELKFRPNFSVVDEMVNLPVIFAKVSGVKDGLVSQYWSDIKLLLTEDTFIIKNAPYLHATDANPIKPHVTEFFKNARLQKQQIKTHQAYQYGFLREEVQDYLLAKLQLLIEQRIIKGTFENGTEYTIISIALNLNKDIIRMIQKFDFTKKNPKIIYINTVESIISLEDSILVAFMNLIGFDVVFFIPTGYQNVSKHFNKSIMEEHQIGEYVYDLEVPDFLRIPSKSPRTWREKIFKRGN